MSDANEPRTRESKMFRLDLVIAICALFVSSLATAATWWQSRVVAQQLSSQVWPYLSVQTSYDRASVALTIPNEGLGPARVRSVVLSLDGTPRQRLTDVLHVIAPATRRNLRGQFTDIERGSVIRVGGTARCSGSAIAPSWRRSCATTSAWIWRCATAQSSPAGAGSCEKVVGIPGTAIRKS